MSASSRARDWVARYGVGAALAARALVAAVFVLGFFGLENLSTVLLHVSVNGILALGLTFVIVTGGIDLSVGSVVGLAGVFAAAALTGSDVLRAVGVAGATILAVGVALGTGAAVGAANGAATAGLRIAPFIVTLATMTIARGPAPLPPAGVPIRLPPAGHPLFAPQARPFDA